MRCGNRAPYAVTVRSVWAIEIGPKGRAAAHGNDRAIGSESADEETINLDLAEVQLVPPHLKSVVHSHSRHRAELWSDILASHFPWASQSRWHR